MVRKDKKNRTCERCGRECSSPQMLRAHLNRKNSCRPQRYRRDPMPAPQPSPEAEFRADNENNLNPEPISEVNQEKNNSDLEESWTEFLKYLGVKPDDPIPIEISNAVVPQQPYGQASSS